MTTETATSPWRVIEWTDAESRVVRELVFHEDELRGVIDLPFPPGAVAREPVMEFTTFNRRKPIAFFRRRKCPFKVGDCFSEVINQGERDCMVVAVDEESGDFLYDYVMPAGRMFYRCNGRPVNPKSPPKKWRSFFSEQ